MRVFITGAGFSAEAGYPVTSTLFKELDSFIGENPPSRDGFHWMNDWPRFKEWLQKANTFLVRESGRQRNIENILTVMDLYLILKEGMLLAWTRDSAGNPRWSARNRYRREKGMLNEIERNRRLLSTGLVQYFEYRHHFDFQNSVSTRQTLRGFCDKKLKAGDVIVTFNYDSCLERTLWESDRWRPEDGYGFPVALRSTNGTSDESKPHPSEITLLKLHGSVGWYGIDGKQVFLSSPFLQYLGIHRADKRAPAGAWAAQSSPAVIEPSLVKRFENQVLLTLWQRAAEFLSQAEEVFILGYSLPEADSASATLLATTCRKGKKKIEVVNKNSEALQRFERLLPACVRKKMTIRKWLSSAANSSTL